MHKYLFVAVYEECGFGEEARRRGNASALVPAGETRRYPKRNIPRKNYHESSDEETDPANVCFCEYHTTTSNILCLTVCGQINRSPNHSVWLGSLVVGVSDPMTTRSWVRSLTTALSSNNLGQVVHTPQLVGAMSQFGGPAD